MKRRIRVLAVLLSAAMFAGACQAEPQKTEEEKKIEKEQNIVKEEKEYQAKLNLIQPSAYSNADGLKLEKGSYISIIGKAKGNDYWDEVEKGALQAAADINEQLGYEGKDKIKVTYSAPDTADDVDEQVNILDEELARYPIAVGIAIADAKACEVQFDLATDSEIPVVAFDSGSDYQGVMATVSTDNEAAAKEAAVKLAEEIGDEGEIILFVQDSKSKAALLREKGITEEIQTNHPNISIVNVYHMDQLEEMQKIVADEINAGTYQIDKEETGEDAADGAEREKVTPESITEEQVIDYILAKHPNIKGCLATNEGSLLLALDGLERNAMNTVKVVGFDASEKEVQALSDGKVTGLIAQNPFGMGYATVVAAARAALNMGNEAVVNTGYTWVTQEGLEEEAIQKILY
ncbi:MAG: substrate-binding domain-containing protein [Dorea sp.]|nr:substrate-binding domain-containing protein [Dorea sp.]